MIRQSALSRQPWIAVEESEPRAEPGTMRSEELGLLSRVLETHCSTYGIRSDEGRDSVAQSVIGYFRSGVTSEDELLASLEREDRPLDKVHTLRVAPKIVIGSNES